MDNLLIQILGLLAAMLTSSSMIPQAIKSIRYKQIDDLSIVTYSLLVAGVVMWIVYGIIQEDIPIVLANGIALIPTSVILFLKIKNIR